MSIYQASILYGLLILVLVLLALLLTNSRRRVSTEENSGIDNDEQVEPTNPQRPPDGEDTESLTKKEGKNGFSSRKTWQEGKTSMANLKLKTKLYHYAAYVTDVYDGDTVTVDIDLGMGLWQHNQRIRLWKINTPELRGPEREAGIRVRDFVRALVLDRDILLRTILDKRGQDRTGKFGRLLGEILVEDEAGELININELLLTNGMAIPFGEDGARVRSAAPPGTHSTPMPLSPTMPCPHCGETRNVEPQHMLLLDCPNCLDGAFQITQ